MQMVPMHRARTAVTRSSSLHALSTSPPRARARRRRSEGAMPPRLTDEVFERLERDSFAVVHSFLPADQLAEIATAVRELHPKGGPLSLAFPYLIPTR